MDLKSLIQNTKQTLTIIHLNDIRFGYFILGKNEITFLGDEVSDTIKNNGNIDNSDKCIGITIDGDMAVLDTLFLSPPGKKKTDCTKLDSVMFFNLFVFSFFFQGTIVEKSSGPCLLCRCGYNEKLECEPQTCEPKFMLEKMLKFHRRK